MYLIVNGFMKPWVSVYNYGLWYIYIYTSVWWLKNHLEKYEFVNGKDYPIYYGK